MIIYNYQKYWLPQWAFRITNPSCIQYSSIANYTFPLCYNVVIHPFNINIKLNLLKKGDFGTKTTQAISWIHGTDMTGTHVGRSITEIVIHT